MCVGVVLFFTYHTVWLVCAGQAVQKWKTNQGSVWEAELSLPKELCIRQGVDIPPAPHEGAVLKSDVYFASVKYRIRAK